MRRAELSIQTPSLRSRSRNVLTCALANSPTRAPQAKLLIQNVGGGCEQHAQPIGQKDCAAAAINLQSMVQLPNSVLHIALIAVDFLYRCRAEAFRLVTTKRGLSFGSRPSCRTTSALIRTRRL